MTTKSSDLWQKLSNKEYRANFATLQIKRGVPFQIRALMKKRGWTQEQLAERSGLTQGAISRARNPDYGNLTLNTISRIAAGYDVAFVGQFVPFSRLVKWFEGLSEGYGEVPTFEEEDARSIGHEDALHNRQEEQYKNPETARPVVQITLPFRSANVIPFNSINRLGGSSPTAKPKVSRALSADLPRLKNAR